MNVNLLCCLEQELRLKQECLCLVRFLRVSAVADIDQRFEIWQGTRADWAGAMRVGVVGVSGCLCRASHCPRTQNNGRQKAPRGGVRLTY